MKKATQTYDGIDQLRLAVKLFANCNETFNQQFTGEELLTLWRMYRDCGWDMPPDCWEERQIREALEKNIVPKFQEKNNVRGGVAALYPNDPTYRIHSEGETTTVTAEEFFDDNAAEPEIRGAVSALKIGESHNESEWQIERVT